MIFCSKIHYIYRKDACAGVAWPEYRQQSFPNQSLGLLWEKVIFANFPHCCHMLVSFHIYLPFSGESVAPAPWPGNH